VREHGIGVEDLESAEVKRHDFAIIDEKMGEHAWGVSDGIR